MTADLSNKSVEELAVFYAATNSLFKKQEAFYDMARRLEEAQQRNADHDAKVAAKALEELHAELMAKYLGWDEWVLKVIKGKAAEYLAKATEAGRKE